jgi:putative multiple sugar transport system permease protein
MNTFTLKAVMTTLVMIGVTYIFASYQAILSFGHLSHHGSLCCDEQDSCGRQIYATGGNRKRQIVRYQTKITFWVFVNMGAMAIAGLILAARLNAATPQAIYFHGWMRWQPYTSVEPPLQAGSEPSIRTIVSGLVMGVLNNRMSILVGVDWQQTIKGLILLLAVVLDIYNKKKLA